MELGSLMYLIDFAGVIASFIAVVVILASMKKIGGKVAGVFTFVMWGVVFQAVSSLYTLVVIKLAIIPAPFVDMRHIFLNLAVVMFLAGAKKFYDLSK